MAKTIITHPDGTRTTVQQQSGCAGCFYVLLGIFVVFAPAAWVGSGQLPVAAAVVMYLIEAVLLLAWLATRTQRPKPAVTATTQAPPPAPTAHGSPITVPPLPSSPSSPFAHPVAIPPPPPPMWTPDGQWVSYDDGKTFKRAR